MRTTIVGSGFATSTFAGSALRVGSALLAGSALIGCTSGTSYGVARYSGDRAPAALAPASPNVRRASAPVWPSEAPRVAEAPRALPPPPMPAPAASQLAPPARTTSSGPVLLSSRTPTTVAPPVALRPLPPPASRARTAAELAAALRPINATCPVMVGAPIDTNVTASFQGRVVGFCNAKSRSAWLDDPERFSANLPGVATASAFGSPGAFGSAGDRTPFAAPYHAAVAAPTWTAPTARPPATVAPSYLPPAVSRSVPVAPPAVVARPPAAAPAPPAGPDAGGACEGGDCPGGNCTLPPRRR